MLDPLSQYRQQGQYSNGNVMLCLEDWSLLASHSLIPLQLTVLAAVRNLTTNLLNDDTRRAATVALLAADAALKAAGG